MANTLKRVIKVPGAIMMGLGSIIGTGIFVSIAIATQIAGNGILFAIIIAALLAILNGLSSAQLAAAHPVSGGTYEYGYRFLGSYFGFTAGWMFMTAKSASAATAVLGCIGYLFYAFNIESNHTIFILASLSLLWIVTILVSGGIRRSNLANKLIVSITLFGLAALILSALFVNGLPIEPLQLAINSIDSSSILHGAALMFVAYTGYGRIATLSEEVLNPQKTIPKAIIFAMAIIVLLYLLVALTALNIMDAESFGATVEGEAAPLMAVSQVLSLPWLGTIVTLSAITAMIGVLINLILGLSRVLLGMARRRDVPWILSRVNPQTQSPVISVLVTSIIVSLLILSGDIVFTWSFSAFTVLIYYSITNLAALKLPDELRLYPKWISVAGLAGCLFLAFWIDFSIWIPGLVLLAIGLIWHTITGYSVSR